MSDEDLIFKRRLENWELAHPRIWIHATDRRDVAEFISGQTRRIVRSQLAAADRIIVSQDRIATEIDRGFEELIIGFEELASAFDWGFSELVWQLEQQNTILKDILKVLQAPLDTHAKELKKRAEDAYRNGWYDDALQNFLESEKKNRYDFTIHHYLGNIFLFIKKNPERALEYYEKAIKYAIPKSSYHASISLLHIGVIYYLKKNFQKAYESSSEAIKLSPDLSEGYYQHAQYCACICKYGDAIEHLKIAILEDKYYCIKANSEKDFNVMKKQLKALFEELRDEACDRGLMEINEAQNTINYAETYGVYNNTIEAAREKLKKAKSLFKKENYFDYLYSIQEARDAQKIASNSSIEFLSNKISEKEKKIYLIKNDMIKKPYGEHEGIIKIIFLFELIPFILYLIYKYTYVVFLIDKFVNFHLTWFLAWFLPLLSLSIPLIIIERIISNRYKSLIKNEEDKLSLLKKKSFRGT